MNLFVLSLVLAVSGASKARDIGPDLSGYRSSYRIPFSGNIDFNKLQGMHIRASINGGPASGFQVDTGSVGVVVSADEVPNIEPDALSGSIKYSSSGVELDGVWTKATITFPDSTDGAGHMANAIVPVLAVRERKVSGVGVNAGRAKAALNPRVHMFGVGFGRGVTGHPEKNPFLNLAEMRSGQMRRGYTITRDGYTLGLTTKNVGTGYVFQSLKQRSVAPETKAVDSKIKDWETAPGSFSVDDKKAELGTILMDTGLTNMMLALPGNTETGDLQERRNITISLLDGKLTYSFQVGDAANTATPRKVTWIKPTHGVFVNTGLRAFALFDYLYDADGGFLGLRAR